MISFDMKNKNPLGIYIHIPFCRQKCKYCDFNSYSGMENMSFSYTDALVREIELSEYKGILDTVYIGGGTPTYLDAKLIQKIMKAVRENFTLTEDCEITIECNPGTADLKKLRALKDCGINRLSIGLQSDNDEILKTLGRIHTYAEFKDCLFSAAEAGFGNISIDLMFGLPGQTAEIWNETLRRAVKLPISHISAYALKIEPGTPFYTLHKNGNLTVPDDDLSRNMYDDCVKILSENGFERYEISNFAKSEKYSRHNLKYWTGGDYIGFGAGACSRIGLRRFSNLRGIGEYIAAIEKYGTAENKSETIINNKSDAMSEYVFLALRLDSGINKTEFNNKFGIDIYEVFQKPLEKHIKLTKVLTDSGGHIKIKPEYTYVSNIIMADFA